MPLTPEKRLGFFFFCSKGVFSKKFLNTFKSIQSSNCELKELNGILLLFLLLNSKCGTTLDYLNLALKDLALGNDGRLGKHVRLPVPVGRNGVS